MKPKKNTYDVLRLILGDQLNYSHSWYHERDKNILYVIMEVRQETDYVTHHIQKVIAFFAAMYNFALWLSKKGHEVYHIKINDPENLQSITDNLDWLIKKYKIKHFEYQLPDEYRIDEQIKKWIKQRNISFKVYDSEHFITKRDFLKEFFTGKKRCLMEAFYRHLRKKTGILMRDDRPITGVWNYDVYNRLKYRGKEPLPEPLLFPKDLRSIENEILKAGIRTIGRVDASQFPWPVTRKESLKLLDHFIEHSLPWFGQYQDSMAINAWLLFHSRLSFSLNTKMLNPLEVIRRIEQAWIDNPVRYPISSVEGFIRQILGWREYVRGIYWMHMPEYSKMNFFEHTNKLPYFYWTGDTKMQCIRECIRSSLEKAYAHHIQRLMVIGAFALIVGVHPDYVDSWFMGIYIDAIEWVEMPNTRGMSQYADGGIVGTKPYVGTASYINKMSDYCKYCAYYHYLRAGKNSCPFNSLFWHFFHRHRKKLHSNPRIGTIYKTWDRFTDSEKREILSKAEEYLSDIENL